MIRSFITASSFSLVLLLWGCGGSSVSTEKAMAELDSINAHANVPKVDKEAINQIMQSVPSPLEISFLIKETGGVYRKDFLNPTENVSKYNSSYEKALNLGIYGADLAYSNIYGKSQDGLSYLGAVTDMADGMNIGQFFDMNTLSRLIKHNNNLDSLLLMSTSNFEKINLYLQEQNRAQLSILLLVGGWVEGLNLLCEVHNVKANNELKERIGEQQIVIEQLIKLLSFYEYDKNIKVLSDDLKKLNELFKQVKIEVVEGETSFQEVDGVMMIVDNSTSKVIVSDDLLKQISTVTKEVRKKITK